MKTFNVEIARIDTRVMSFQVKGEDSDEAFERALELAHNFDYGTVSSNCAEYDMVDIEEISEDVIKAKNKDLQDRIDKLASWSEDGSHALIDNRVSRIETFNDEDDIISEISFSDICLSIYTSDITDVVFEGTFAHVYAYRLHYMIQFLMIKDLEGNRCYP